MSGHTITVRLSERTEHRTSVQVETEDVIPGTDITAYHSFEVDDTEPLDVLGPILSRVLEELGYWLDDPGDFDWIEHPTETGTYTLTIRSTFRGSP